MSVYRSLPLVLALACAGPSVPEDTDGDGVDTSAVPEARVLTAVSTDTLPASAPGVVLLAELSAAGEVRVGGTVQAEMYVDLDGPTDDRYGFRYQVVDGAGAVLYERSTSGPLIVRDFLAYYGELSGYDILDLMPMLGGFPVTVPVLDGGVGVRFQVRDDTGVYQDVGAYDLANVAADDHGLLDDVSGVETLHEAGPPENTLDVVLLGDGYTEAELETWRADAAVLAGEILATAPLSDFADAINVHRVDAASAESGISYDCVGGCESRDTAYGTIFPLEVINRLLGTDHRANALFQLDQWRVARGASVVPWDVVVIVANTEHEGGFAVHYATVAKGTDGWERVGVHELGHVLGLLGDEYERDYCIRSASLGLPENVTDTPTAPRWAHWIEADTPLPTAETDEHADHVGAFEGAYNCADLYRPALRCRMKSSSSGDFCPVCAELLTRRVFRHLDPATGVSVAPRADGGLSFTVEGARADAVAAWAVDGVPAGEGPVFELDAGAISAGAHNVDVQVTVGTGHVRVDEGDLSEGWGFGVE